MKLYIKLPLILLLFVFLNKTKIVAQNEKNDSVYANYNSRLTLEKKLKEKDNKVGFNKNLKKANAQYDHYAFSAAIPLYEDALEHTKDGVEIYKKLGDCYYFNSDLPNAAKWYDRLIKYDTSIEPEVYFRYAQALKSLKNYNKADEIMQRLKDSATNDTRALRYINNPDYLKDIESNSGRFTIKLLPQNTPFTDFAPSFFGDSLVFSSAKGKKEGTLKRNKWTNQPYLDLFLATEILENSELEKIIPLGNRINTRLHESTSIFTKDGNKIYFTRNDLTNQKIGHDSTNTTRLKIYSALRNENNNWVDITELPFNGADFSSAHPALSPDEKKLYFASDRTGTHGLSDLFYVDILEDGSYSDPVNLGKNINTEGRETFPFIDSDGTLYFASDGHLGLGGLDIFTVQTEDDAKIIQNIGTPINSPADDITFIINLETKKGYFASNREGGIGEDDIYSFENTGPMYVPCEGLIEGIVLDKDSGRTLPNTAIVVKNSEAEILFDGVSDAAGKFSLPADCEQKKYDISVTKENYGATTVNGVLSKESPTIYKKIELKKEGAAKGVDLALLLDLNPIYFQTNKAIIQPRSVIELDKVVNYMRTYPAIKIQIGSHTDSRGSDSYNLSLSKKRAASTAKYIIDHGINLSRVGSKGFGETVLKNNCGNGVKCSDLEHQANRRSEFIVVD